MASFDKPFDSSKHDDMQTFEVFPPGEYPMNIVKSDIKDTKAGTGKFISLQMEVLNGEHKGRAVFTNINIQNPNLQAVEIGQKELATLCRAVNVPQLKDTNQLHRIPFIATVDIEQAKGDWPEKNKIIGYAPYTEGEFPQVEETKQSESFDSNVPEWAMEQQNKTISDEPADDDDIPF